jgi:hypothetical protein
MIRNLETLLAYCYMIITILGIRNTSDAIFITSVLTSDNSTLYYHVFKKYIVFGQFIS